MVCCYEHKKLWIQFVPVPIRAIQLPVEREDTNIQTKDLLVCCRIIIKLRTKQTIRVV